MPADTKTTLTWILKDEVSGKARDIKGSLDAAGTSAQRGGGLFGSLGGAIGGLVNPATLAVAGVGALAAGLGMAIGAAAEEEINVKKLQTALETSVPGWNGNTDAIEALIATRENLAFSDDELRNSMALLVTGTHDVEEAQNLQATAMDLARLKGVDLETATTAILRATQGSTRELKALGLEIDDNATATENLAQIQNAAAGQAAAYADTSAAKWEVLQNKFGDVVETVGAALLPIVEDLLDFLIDDIIPAVQDLADALTPALQNAFKVVGQVIGWFIDNVVKPAIDFIGDLIGVISDAVDWFNSLIGAKNRNAQTSPGGLAGARNRTTAPSLFRYGRQHGGPVEADETYLVGETGPELLVMGNRGGMVIPGDGFGGTIHVPVYLDGQIIADVVDRRLGERPRTSSVWTR